MKRGFDALERGEAEAALKIGQDLLKRKHTSGFEIAARALWDLERCDEAVKMLEDGVTKAPVVFNLWDYLGSYCSDLGRFDEALRAFTRALECEGGGRDATLYNIAIVHQPQGNHEAALARLREIHGHESLMPEGVVRSLEVQLLVRLGRSDEAISLADHTIAKIEAQADPDEPVPEGLAGLYAWRGQAAWHSRKDRESALADAWHAVRIERLEKPAAELIREVEAKRSEHAKRWRVMIKGRWHEPFEGEEVPNAFLTHYEVVADDLDEALAFCARHLPEPVRPSLRVEESTLLDEHCEEYKGVVQALCGLIFFPEE